MALLHCTCWHNRTNALMSVALADSTMAQGLCSATFYAAPTHCCTLWHSSPNQPIFAAQFDTNAHLNLQGDCYSAIERPKDWIVRPAKKQNKTKTKQNKKRAKPSCTFRGTVIVPLSGQRIGLWVKAQCSSAAEAALQNKRIIKH